MITDKKGLWWWFDQEFSSSTQYHCGTVWQHIAVLWEACNFPFTIITSAESVQFNSVWQVFIEDFKLKWKEIGLGFRFPGFDSGSASYLLFDFY